MKREKERLFSRTGWFQIMFQEKARALGLSLGFAVVVLYNCCCSIETKKEEEEKTLDPLSYFLRTMKIYWLAFEISFSPSSQFGSRLGWQKRRVEKTTVEKKGFLLLLAFFKKLIPRKRDH
jgi:hypothetical protein